MDDKAPKKTILVVEDEPDEAMYLTALFEDHGYEASSASNGAEAMASVKEKRPVLITLDMTMPGQSGVKFYRELREDPELNEVPVLVVSGFTGLDGKPEEIANALSTHESVKPPEGFVAKPIDQQQLLGMVAKLLT